MNAKISERENCACVSVKFYGQLAGDAPDDVRERAWEDVQREFWSDAKEHAQALGFDDAYSFGRSGGWCAPVFLNPARVNYSDHARGADMEDARERRKFYAFARRVEKMMSEVQARFTACLTLRMREESQPVSVLSIDAWRDGSGWTWNSWYKVGAVPVAWCDAKPRGLFAMMREAGWLGADSPGRVMVEDDGYNLVICARGTGEPLFAIAYGEANA